MSAAPEEEYLSLSGLQHFAFCRRQWALIHIERQWAETVLAEMRALYAMEHTSKAKPASENDQRESEV